MISSSSLGAVEQVLAPFVARRRAGDPDDRLREELLEAILPWVTRQIERTVRRIPDNADPANVSSHLHEAAYQAVARLDWDQWETWPHYLATLVRRAAQEAARSDDYLSRHHRAMRTRFRSACQAEESRLGRPVDSAIRQRIAHELADGRTDLADFLLIGLHPREMAEFPDERPADISVEDEVERSMVRCEVQQWVTEQLPDDVREMVVEWLRSPRSQTLPRRLERQLRPHMAQLLDAVDDVPDPTPWNGVQFATAGPR